MATSDLDAVASRRAAIARWLFAFETNRAALVNELDELDVTERVLNRIERLLQPEIPVDQAANHNLEDRPQRRGLGVLRSLMGDH